MINSTMFNADLWTRMAERLVEMTKPGCFVLTLSGEIPGCSGLGKDPHGPGACWEKLVAYQTTMSWGRTQVHLFVRTEFPELNEEED